MSNVTPLAPQRPCKALCNIETEFMMLVALRDRTNSRLNELTDQLWIARGLPPSPLQRMRAEDAERAKSVSLPISGLVQSAPGVLLFKGGRDA